MIDRVLPYYKWFWQDWRANRKIQRMSYIERGLYRELLDECWVEGFIPSDIEELADICGCPVEVMADAWQVLSKCFDVLEDGKLVNEKLHSLRTEKDVERLKKSENGKKGGIAKAIAKQVPSNSHIEEKRREKKKREEIATPDGVSESTFTDFMKLRKAKRLPWTETVEKSFRKEAEKIKWSMQEVIEYCCKRSWAGFEASWVKTDEKSKELPLGTDQQIAHAYKVECGGDPTQSRFNSYFEMRKYILDQRDKRKVA